MRIAALLVCMLACAQLGSASMLLKKHMLVKHLPKVSAAPAVSAAPGSGITPGAVPVACASAAAAAQAAGNFTALLGAAQATGLASVLADPAFKGTIFAPTDVAFAEALTALGVSADQLLAQPQLLQAILMYHVVPGTALSLADLSDSMKLPTLLSQSIPADVATQARPGFKAHATADDKYQLTLAVLNVFGKQGQRSKRVTVVGDESSAKVIAADVNAGCPAIIHVIDNVLIPGGEEEADTGMAAGKLFGH